MCCLLWLFFTIPEYEEIIQVSCFQTWNSPSRNICHHRGKAKSCTTSPEPSSWLYFRQGLLAWSVSQKSFTLGWDFMTSLDTCRVCGPHPEQHVLGSDHMKSKTAFAPGQEALVKCLALPKPHLAIVSRSYWVTQEDSIYRSRLASQGAQVTGAWFWHPIAHQGKQERGLRGSKIAENDPMLHNLLKGQMLRHTKALGFCISERHQSLRNYMTALGFDSWLGSVWDPNQDNHSFN